MTFKQKDNHNPEAKLAIRRHFIRKYHTERGAPRISVFDCCMGQGKIWNALRQEFDFDYWGVDEKPALGRLKIDSVKILAQTGWTQNVIDIDTYGAPWKHWFAMLPNTRSDITVFLTDGSKVGGMGNIPAKTLAAAGIPFKCPTLLAVQLSPIFPSLFLADTRKFGLTPVEIAEAPNDGNAKYFGVRLVKNPPHKTNGTD